MRLPRRAVMALAALLVVTVGGVGVAWYLTTPRPNDSASGRAAPAQPSPARPPTSRAPTGAGKSPSGRPTGHSNRKPSASHKKPKPNPRKPAPAAGVDLGTAVNMSLLADDPSYRRIVAREFSSLTPENSMKWGSVEQVRGTYDWSQADALVDFAMKYKKVVRGHTLVWHSQLPSWLQQGLAARRFTSTQLRALLRRHVTDETRHFRGRIKQWDVVNEAFSDTGGRRPSPWQRHLGSGYIADSFRWAHAADPKAKLFYNDYDIEGIGPKSNAVYAMVKEFKARGVPIDGVGFQTHLGQQYPFPTDFRKNLQRFADLGLQVSLTEVDVRMELPVTAQKTATQAQYYTSVFRDCLKVKGCVSITLWGFDDRHSWVSGWFPGEGSATPFDGGYRPKPVWAETQRILRSRHSQGRD
jgi:endo-1,4-beta-xylanase